MQINMLKGITVFSTRVLLMLMCTKWNWSRSHWRLIKDPFSWQATSRGWPVPESQWWMAACLQRQEVSPLLKLSPVWKFLHPEQTSANQLFRNTRLRWIKRERHENKNNRLAQWWNFILLSRIYARNSLFSFVTPVSKFWFLFKHKHSLISSVIVITEWNMSSPKVNRKHCKSRANLILG